MQTLKSQVGSILKQAGIYNRLKNSCVHELFWRIADKRWIESRTAELEFYRSILIGFRRGDLIFDVGANVGAKTDVFLRLGARVIAVEPDECNQQILREQFLKYRIVPKPVRVVGKAVSDNSAVETMWVDGPGSALNTLSRKWVDALRQDKSRFEHTTDVLEFAQTRRVETTTIEQLISAYGLPFFIKIDVEGYELRVLRGMRCPVRYLSFEVNLPEFRSEALQCLEVLQSLAPTGEFNYLVDCKSGLALDRWVDKHKLSVILEQCSEKCIEVFWHLGLA